MGKIEISFPRQLEEELDQWRRDHPQVHEERRKLTPEEEEYWVEMRARFKEMRKKMKKEENAEQSKKESSPETE